VAAFSTFWQPWSTCARKWNPHFGRWTRFIPLSVVLATSRSSDDGRSSCRESFCKRLSAEISTDWLLRFTHRERGEPPGVVIIKAALCRSSLAGWTPANAARECLRPVGGIVYELDGVFSCWKLYYETTCINIVHLKWIWLTPSIRCSVTYSGKKYTQINGKIPKNPILYSFDTI